MMRVAPDPASSDLLMLAARGDGAAQLALVDHAYQRFNEGEVSFAHAVTVAEVFARLAVVHDTPDAWMRLVRVLFDLTDLATQAGDHGQALEHVADGIRILNRLADAGNEAAGTALVRLGDLLGGDNMRDAVAAAREIFEDEREQE